MRSDHCAQANAPAEPAPAPRFLTRAEVERRVGLRRSAIYRRMREGRFPQPVHDIDSATVWWLESEIEAWQRARIAAREASGNPMERPRNPPRRL